MSHTTHRIKTITHRVKPNTNRSADAPHKNPENTPRHGTLANQPRPMYQHTMSEKEQKISTATARQILLKIEHCASEIRKLHPTLDMLDAMDRDFFIPAVLAATRDLMRPSNSLIYRSRAAMDKAARELRGAYYRYRAASIDFYDEVQKYAPAPDPSPETPEL